MYRAVNQNESLAPKWVSRGLFWAWVLNDLEELFTMGPWSREHAPEMAKRVPVRLPEWAAGGVSETHVRVAITIMGGVMYAFAARGDATGGRSRLYQAALLGFGAHGFSHLTNSLSWRGYTPGVATAPTVVIPFSALAMHRLAKDGVLSLDRVTVGLGIVGPPAVMFGIHALTHRVLKAVERVRER